MNRRPNWMRVRATLLAGLLMSAGIAAAPPAVRPDFESAAALYAKKDYEGARNLLIEHLKREGEDARAHALLGRVDRALDRKDEAAHHLEKAYDLTLAAGDEREARELLRDLYRVDANARSRRLLFERITTRAVEAAEDLSENGSTERALALLQSVLSIAIGADAARAHDLHAELRKSREEVDLDAASAADLAPGEWPEYEASSVRYDLKCHLEPDVVNLVGETMDHIFDYYVQLYFDGDDSAISKERATILIHPTKEKMLENWSGGSAPEGWWSPGTKEVVSFDTRTSSGTLGALLETLFHEASHQFMTLMTKGGRAPAWLNEGTASFFEGAVAMADNRVLWPDAALGRLMHLSLMLERGTGPKPREVVAYSEPQSYPGEYYAFGWGLVYYLQQWEDPETLEYVYRPLYGEYRDRITKSGEDSFALFEEVFLGKRSPRGHKTFADFEADWRKWILEEIKPLHATPPADRRSLRLALVERYVAAADRSAAERKPKVSESELLRRALGHLEYVRTRIDGEDAPDGDLILRQAAILERLGYKESVAPLLESWLDLVDEGLVEAEEGQYEQLEKKLTQLDSRNNALRASKSRMLNLKRNAESLLAKYERDSDGLPLRTYTLAASLARFFDDEELRARAVSAKEAARSKGSLIGSVQPLTGKPTDWVTVFSGGPGDFELEADAVIVRSLRPAGRILSTVESRGEFEVRARIQRRGPVVRGSFAGLVVSGRPDGDWWIVGLDDSGSVAVQHVAVGGGGTSLKRLDTLHLSKPVAEGESPLLTVHAAGGGTLLEILVEGRELVRFDLPAPLPPNGSCGAFAKDADVRFENPVLEVFP